ncbi:hypothetical protein CRG98_046420 [Punica granatum]|uniref:X8 domain-containing protein n=1 Tax=Punica granatum TaxID=22663 RepID=A0A2I0HN95_PUNGR|nr:hypothetical protein CRG98_046420 [Punica granatum]
MPGLSTLEALRPATARPNVGRPHRTSRDNTTTASSDGPIGSCNGNTFTERPAARSLLLSLSLDNQGPLMGGRHVPTRQVFYRITKATSETNGSWCIAKTGAKVSKLQAALDYACGHGADCAPIQPGALCFEPNTIAAHASYAMNALYQHFEKKPTNCDFGGSAMLTSSDPSHGNCVYPGK